MPNFDFLWKYLKNFAYDFTQNKVLTHNKKHFLSFRKGFHWNKQKQVFWKLSFWLFVDNIFHVLVSLVRLKNFEFKLVRQLERHFISRHYEYVGTYHLIWNQLQEQPSDDEVFSNQNSHKENMLYELWKNS